jgi:hypothetical protein
MKLANLTAQLAAAETELADFKLVLTEIEGDSIGHQACFASTSFV